MNHVPSQMYKFLNNLTMFLRYHKMCVTLLTERDDGRYLNVLATGRDGDRYVAHLQLHETTIASILRNDRTSFQIISAKLKCSVKCYANNLIYSFMCLHHERLQEIFLQTGKTRKMVGSFKRYFRAGQNLNVFFRLCSTL